MEDAPVLRALLSAGRSILQGALVAILLGLFAPAPAIGPSLVSSEVVVEVIDAGDQPAPVVVVYLAAYRANGPPVVAAVIVCTSTPSAWPRVRGMWFDGGADGLYKTQTRYYQPGVGRFTQSDPAQAGSNWYAYCDGDPVNRTDPSGLDYIDAEGGMAMWYIEQEQAGAVWGTNVNVVGKVPLGEIMTDGSFSYGGRFYFLDDVRGPSGQFVNTGSWSGAARRSAIRTSLGSIVSDILNGRGRAVANADHWRRVQSAQGRGVAGANRVIAGSATVLGSVGLAVVTGGATSVTASVGLDQAWAGTKDIWNADDEAIGPSRTKLAEAIGDRPAAVVEITSNLVTAPGLVPSAPGAMPRMLPPPTIAEGVVQSREFATRAGPYVMEYTPYVRGQTLVLRDIGFAPKGWNPDMGWVDLGRREILAVRDALVASAREGGYTQLELHFVRATGETAMQEFHYLIEIATGAIKVLP